MLLDKLNYTSTEKTTTWAARSQAAIAASQPSPHGSIPKVLLTLKTATELWESAVRLFKRATGNWINTDSKGQRIRDNQWCSSQNAIRWIQTDLRLKFAFSCWETVWEAALEGATPDLTQNDKLKCLQQLLDGFLTALFSTSFEHSKLYLEKWEHLFLPNLNHSKIVAELCSSSLCKVMQEVIEVASFL